MNKYPSSNEEDVRIEPEIKAGTKIPAVLELKLPYSA